VSDHLLGKYSFPQTALNVFVSIVDCAVNFITGLKTFTAYFLVVLLLQTNWHIFVIYGIFWNAIRHILSLWTWQHCKWQFSNATVVLG